MNKGAEWFGRFRIDRELGRGGQAVVHLAEDTRLARKVALKVFSRGPGVDEPVFRRFKREVEVAARLDHPGICTVHDAGVDRGVPFIAMRHVEGETMARKIARAREGGGTSSLRPALLATDDRAEPQHTANAPASERQSGDLTPVVRLMERAARAVHAAHEAGITHRDIKPGNIMVTPEGDPVVLDFGLARDEEISAATLTVPSEPRGTPAYMAPEQIQSSYGRPDRRTDVYSMGVTLYECVTLHLPFEAQTRDGIYRAILSQDPANAQRFNPAVPRDLRVVLETALAKEQDRRYQTALDLAEDLRRVCEHKPILARPAGPLLRLRRWARRSPAPAAGMGGLILVLALGTAIGGYLLRVNQLSLTESRRFVDAQALPHLEQAAGAQLAPALPRGIPEMDAWLEDAEALYAHLDEHQAHLRRLRAGASEDPEIQRESDELAAFVERLASLPEAIEAVRTRREAASTIAQRTIDAYLDVWYATIEVIADKERNPQYDGLMIHPQVGLVPIGQDPDSRLFEFAHLQTGEVPARHPATGRLLLTGETGLVFVLVPGGAFNMGSEPPSEDKPVGSPNVDPHSTIEDDERPVHRVELEPFFVSKYEMTQAQWRRVTGENPSKWTPGRISIPLWGNTILYPVDTVSWVVGNRVLSCLGLTLPTEAQWEYAARAGTTTVWWTGEDWRSLRGAENLSTRRRTPVGSYRPNAYGLHDVLGNVGELVRDWYGSYELPPRCGDGERGVQPSGYRVRRGGDDHSPPNRARSAKRGRVPPNDAWQVGVRPARPLTEWDGQQANAPAAGHFPSFQPTELTVGASITFAIDPRVTFLRTVAGTWNDDHWAPRADPISLADLGIGVGDRVKLQRLGDFDAGLGDASKTMIAIFGESRVLLGPDLLNRVRDAIDAGTDFVTGFGDAPNDIPEDFAIALGGIVHAVSVVVPERATHLFVSAYDLGFYVNNADPDGDFALELTLLDRGDGSARAHPITYWGDEGPFSPAAGSNLRETLNQLAAVERPSLSASMTPGESVVFPIDPKATYLRPTWEEDRWAFRAVPISLDALGIAPGDQIRLERLGDYAGGTSGGDSKSGMVAVFSASLVLLGPDLLRRVRDAIDAGTDFVTDGENTPTDIPEDFVIYDWKGTFDVVSIVVPEGATHLFASAYEVGYYQNNGDPDGDFALRLTLLDRAADTERSK
ncbi:MAG: protein kinase domain-containing protein [Planctomycetota bacterium]